jgi:hypothetical protein
MSGWSAAMNAISFYRAMILLCGLPAVGAGQRVAVVVDSRAPEIERYAATQLCDYLARLFGIQTQPVSAPPADANSLLLVGKAAAASGDQGIVLRRTKVNGQPALIVGGGSPRATLWAVAELVERYWGVRYLLHGDVLPPQRPFSLPDADESQAPVFPIRQWRVLNEFACGPISWGMADYRSFIDQLAKLKFNRLLLSLWPHHPFADYTARGVRRSSATLFFGCHFAITPDMIGQELFGDAAEFWNPDLPIGAGHADLTAAFESLVHQIIDYGHRRGMDCVLTASVTEFPPEFVGVIAGAQKVYQLGSLVIGPGPTTPVDDPGLIEVTSAMLHALVNTYPEADAIAIGMPEHRQWVGWYERAWKTLDQRYGVNRVEPLAQVIDAVHHRTGYAGSVERMQNEVKGDIVNLYFLDRLFRDLAVLKDTRRPDMRLIYNAIAEELFPILSKILPHGSETLNQVDYTASRILKRRQVLHNIPGREIPSVLIYTLHDDNVGLLPQLVTGSFHELTRDLRRYGWAGYSTRYWLIGDHDPVAAYLARASWDPVATPEAVYREQLPVVCGDRCVAPMLAVFREVEATTVNLELNASSLTFPVPGMIMKHWIAKPMPEAWAEARAGYRRALESARRARAVSTTVGRNYIDYWIGRLQFGIGYFDAIEVVRRAALAEAAGRNGDVSSAASTALDNAREAIAAYARVARDQSDRGAIAMLNEYVYRPLRAKAESLRAVNSRPASNESARRP